MPPQPLLTHSQYLTHGLLPIVLATATNTCFICKDPYSAESDTQPVLLPECGHIFCRACLAAWFDSGQEMANTCPLDRQVLFLAETAQEEGTRDMVDADVRVARAVDVRRVERRPFEELVVRGLVVARDGRLTYAGCRFVVGDLWRCTARLLRRVEELSGAVVEPWDISVEAVDRCVRDALPRDISGEPREWEVMYEYARQMLVWHHEGVRAEDVGEGRFADMVHSLYQAGDDGA